MKTFCLGEAFTRMSFRKCLLILLNLEYDMNMDDFEINDYLPEVNMLN